VALIVEDGTGITNAEAYDSIANVTTYLTAYGEDADWSALTADADREHRARRVTRYMDANFGATWKGARSNRTQALDWPRTGVYDNDGFEVSATAMPTRFLAAFAVLCERASTESLAVDQSAPGEIKRIKNKVGSLEQEIEYLGGREQDKFYLLAESLLEEFIQPANLLERA